MSSLEVSRPIACPGATRRAPHPMLTLAVCCLSLFLVTMDVTIVNIALPSIRSDLHASMTGLQWSVDAYTVVVASFLMLAGSTADRFGRRRVFQIGLAVFSLGSLLCSVAPSILILVLCRIVQALGGSMLNPAAMSIITNTFTDGKERARAIGFWAAVTGLSMAAGPLLGGVLTQIVGWRAIFAVNVPIGLAAIALAGRFVPESRAAGTRRFDPIGQVLVVIVLAAFISALIEGPRAGWSSPLIVGLFAASIGAFIALVACERARRDPLIDLRFFGSVPFSAATALAVLAFTAFSGFLFLTSIYLQDARGMTPFAAGFCMLPTAMAMIVCAPLSGRLVAANYTRVAVVIAGIAFVLGAGLLTSLGADSGPTLLLVAYALFGVGLGMVNPPITNAAVSGMPRAQAGVASALASASRVVGAALGVALAGSVSPGRFDGAINSDGAPAAHLFWWIAIGCGLIIVALGIEAARTPNSRPE